jgi:type IV pilus assembly protein PilY1
MKIFGKRLLSVLVSVGMNALPLQGLIPTAHAAGGLNIPTKDQPQVLIILDNSQGMAGVLQGPNGLSGAIMTGSGTVTNNQNSSSPVSYTVSSGFQPPAYPNSSVSNGTQVPYTVPCSSSGLTAAAQSACATIGGNGYVDNSPSMLNAAENSVRAILSNSIYANNLQFGIETYQTSGAINQYDTWVYYMSASGGFSFGNSASNAPAGTMAVPNPCYGSVSNGYFTRYSCYYIYAANLPNLGNYQLYSSPYLYIQDTSDNPIINDVLYSNFYGQGYENSVGAYPNPYNIGNLQKYMQQNVGVNYQAYSTFLSAGMAPTSAGYVPQSFEVWEAQRGFGFNAPTVPDAGQIVVPITAKNTSNANAILKAISPEVFLKSGGSLPRNAPISAAAGYAPVAGAFQTALQYLTGNASNPPPPTCGKKYVIFITDGQPTQGLGGNVYPPLGSAAASTFGVTSISSASAWGTTNNNAVKEAITAIQNLADSGIKTYVLGVGSAVNPNIPGTTPAQQAEALQGSYVLQAMAQAGGTQNFYAATTQADVQAALNNIVANILGKSVVSSYAAPPTVTVGSLEFQLKNINPVTGQGDLFAYPVTSNGSLSTTPSWTANGIMSAGTRAGALYTTPLGGSNNGGAPETFSAVASTNSAAFAISNTSLTASTIANYTVDPSYNGGAYLGGRQSGWFVGLPSSAPARVLTPPASGALLSNGGSYLQFAANHSGRQNAVLFSDNDGFLYAIGYNNTGSPTLLWAWMPGSFLPSLQNYKTFWQGTNMGAFDTIDASPDGGNTWHTYVVGTGSAGGFLVYDLQLTGTAQPNLGSVVAQYAAQGYSQPQNSAPVFYRVQDPTQKKNYGSVWAIFALNNSAGSALGLLNVTSGQWVIDPLPFSNTATPYLDASGNLFLGDASGKVYELPAAYVQSLLGLSNNSGNISLTATSIPSKDFTLVGNYAPWATTGTSLSTAVQFIGGTTYQGYNYLRVQGANGITIFKQSNGVWAPLWTSYSGGSGTWSGGTFSPSLGGSGGPGISPLPSSAAITDQALISGGNVTVPVTVPPASSNSCGVSLAEYFVFNLASGIFPSGALVSPTGSPITQGFVIGQGTAFRPSETIFNGRVQLQGAASRNSSGGTTGFPSALGAGLPLGGPAAWRIAVVQ